MYQKISFKVLCLLFVLITLNYVYKFSFYEKDLQKHSDIINLVRALPNDVDIIYIGESSNTAFRGDDMDKRPISSFVADYFPELKVSSITKPASHSGIYKILLQNIPTSNKAQTIIVTLNLRSFNAQWIHSSLETALQKSMVLIKNYPPLMNRFLLSFKAYDIKTEEEREIQFQKKWERDLLRFPYPFQHKNVIEWDYWMAANYKDKFGKNDQHETELACNYIKTYAFQIDTLSNPRIHDFNDIITHAKQRGWNLVFNLLAENTEKAKQLVGDDLLFLMNENAQLLKNYYQKKGINVVDNLHAIEDEQFIDQNWTTEHYAEKGRKIIAKNVAQACKNFHPTKFVEVNYSKNIQTSFFNNCDDKVVWGQMQTITNETSYSSNNSSKTGKGNDYSITLEYPLKLIPDSLKNNIHIEFKTKLETLNNMGKLAIQANGAHFKSFWHGTDLISKVTKAGTWETFNLTFSIPDSIKNADLIKIYVYNPSKELIYIDDFKIEFE